MKFILMAFIFLLVGCHSTPIKISAKPIERSNLVLPTVDPIKYQPIKWIIVTDKNQDQVFKDLKGNGLPPVLIGLSGNDFKNATLNDSNRIKLIEQLEAIINAYKKYYNKN